MMKKFLPLLLILCLILSGCGGQETEEANAESNYTPPEVVGNTTQTAEKEDFVQKESTTVPVDNGKVQVQDYTGKFPVATAENEFSVFSINLNGADRPDETDRPTQLLSLMDLLLAKNPDVITFQEVGASWMDYIVPQLNGIYDYYLIYPNEENKDDANPIFFKTEKFEEGIGGCFWLSETPDVCSAAADGNYYNCTWLQLKEKATENEIYFFNSRVAPAIGETGAETIRTKCESVGWRKSIVCSVDLGAALDSNSGKTLLKNLYDSNTAGNGSATAEGGVHDFSLYTKISLTPKSYNVIQATELTDHNAVFTVYTVNTETLNYENEFIF